MTTVRFGPPSTLFVCALSQPDGSRVTNRLVRSHRYLWSPAVDQVLADELVATGSPNDVHWPLSDWQGTVRDVATYNAATNVTTIANHNALAGSAPLSQAFCRRRNCATTRRA
ncbi:MAG: hypothetical protein ACOX1P_01290 [Thermoguttaceae bacterium]